MSLADPVFVGIDLGTGGVRAMAVNAEGQLLASAAVPHTGVSEAMPTGWHEQNAQDWWSATRQTIRALASDLRGQGGRDRDVAALCVDGTSGTVLGLDDCGEPVRPALMYNDGRAIAEAHELAVAEGGGPSIGGAIAASHAIAKVRWLQRHEPHHFAATRCFVHQADFIVGRLTGRRDVSDYSNALKMGFDLIGECWPAWLEEFAEILQRLPRVVPPGSVISGLLPTVALELGLPANTQVIAGATDGTAGFIASGATNLGDDNTTLGTTLVFKRLADRPCVDPRGLIYCHKLPGSGGESARWLPGAASNTGCAWMTTHFAGADIQAMDARAAAILPCDALAYPLSRAGERFPFLSNTATGFCDPPAGSALENYAAHLQGLALIERLCYETLDSAAGVCGKDVYATGGGSRSDVWTQLRANVTGRAYHRPACPESAFGAAVLAAAGAHFAGDLWAAIRQMVRIEKSFSPDAEIRNRYDALYGRFKTLLLQYG